MKGIASITIDGVAIEGNKLPVGEKGKEYEVKVIMG